MQNGLSRRDFLRLTAGLMLAAPGFAAAQDDLIQIGTSSAALPTGPTTFRWLDSGEQKAVFWNAFFAQYRETYPNIDVLYDSLPANDLAQISDLAYDVFELPPTMTLAQVVDAGLVAPLDAIVPDFAAWKARFPAGHFVEGITGFNGLTYAFPISSNRWYGTHLLYNVDYMEAAGFDPQTGPMSADAFVEAARRITENGEGRYFGFIMGGNQPDRWGDIVRGFAHMNGAAAVNDIDPRTGEYIYADARFVEGINVLLRIRDNRSAFPGMLALNTRDARARMPQGAAGMILQGPWNIPIWQRENPNFNFDIAGQPLLDDDLLIPMTVEPGGSNRLHVLAGAPDGNQQIAGDIFAYLGTQAGQTAWATLVGAAAPAAFPSALEQVDLSPRERKAIELFNAQVRIGPSPVVRNSEIANVRLEPLTPNFNEVVQGIYTGQISNMQSALQDLQDRANAELDRAIAAAVENSATVSRDDYVFSNWDPNVDYDAALYDEQ